MILIVGRSHVGKVLRRLKTSIIGPVVLSSFGILLAIVVIWKILVSTSPPDFRQMDWESISVTYSVGQSAPNESGTWSTADQNILNAIKESLEVNHTGTLWHIGKMSTNEIRLRVKGGDEWVIYVISRIRFSAYDASKPNRSYLVKTNGGFYDSLMKITLDKETDQVPWFF